MGSSKRAAIKDEVIHEYPGVGSVVVRSSARARRITLSVRPDRTVRLTVPRGVSLEAGLGFLSVKKEWLIKTLARLPEAPEVILPPYLTRTHRLILEPIAVPVDVPAKISIGQGIVVVRYPGDLDTAGDTVQKAVRKGIEEAWRAEAKELLPQRLKELALCCGFKYRSVTIRNTVSKWGSCSARDDISLSLHLMRLPDRLIDYVLVHELCHTVHKNHGPRFHALLDRLTGGCHAALRRELKSFNTRW